LGWMTAQISNQVGLMSLMDLGRVETFIGECQDR
jgi:hypothetical protein